MFLQNDSIDPHYLSGWEEIRSALERVEEFRKQGRDAKVEITNSNADTILRITLRSIDELEQYFRSNLRKLLLQGADKDLSIAFGKLILN